MYLCYWCLQSSERWASKCELDLGRVLGLVESCLEKETDWHVLTRVLDDLPHMLQYEMELVSRSFDFVHGLFKCLYKKEVVVLRNRPDNLQVNDYVAKFFPLVASLILYHPMLDKNSQENILQNIAMGVSHSNRNKFCLEALTIVITEMHESNAKQCSDMIVRFSQMPPSQAMAAPMLELLSTMSDFRRLDFIFDRKELYIWYSLCKKSAIYTGCSV